VCLRCVGVCGKQKREKKKVSHFAHVRKSGARQTSKKSVALVCVAPFRMCDVTELSLFRTCGVTYSCAKWWIRLGDMTWRILYVTWHNAFSMWHDTFSVWHDRTYSMRDMTKRLYVTRHHACMWHDMTHSYVRMDSSMRAIYVTWHNALIFDIMHSRACVHVWHKAFICDTTHVHLCDTIQMTQDSIKWNIWHLIRGGYD